MEYASREVLLKKGNMCVIRRPEERDAETMVEYLKTAWGETRNLMRGPEDMTITVEKERDILREMAESETKLMLIAEIDGQLAGTAGLHPVGERNRAGHRCSIGITIYKAFWRMGIGTVLMEELLEAAETAGFEQAELEVVSTNEAAVGLYQKLGFETIGTIPHALKYEDGAYADFLYMIKRLV